MPTTAQTNLLSWACKFYAESTKCLNEAVVNGQDARVIEKKLVNTYLLRKTIKDSDGLITALQLAILYGRLQCFIELLVDGDISGYNIENSEADCCGGGNSSGGCCKPVLFTMNGVAEKILLYRDWQTYGDIPSLAVIAKINGQYQKADVDPVYDKMPNPSQITVTLDAVPADDWYIWVGA